MFGKFFGLKSKKKYLGVDVGTFFVKIVELGVKGKNFVLENYGQLGVLYPEEKAFRIFEKENLLLSDYDLAKAIRAILDETGIQTKEANFCIPDFSSFFSTLSLPIMSKEELPEAIKYEIRPYIPLPISAITIDWVITEGQVGKTPLKILTVAVPNVVINQYKEIAKISKLNLKIVEPEVFGLARSLKFMFKGKVTALIDIGARSTTCSILNREVLQISNSFNIGSSLLIEAVARTLNMDYNGAEKLLIAQGLIQDNKVAAGFNPELYKIIMPIINGMTEEIKKNIGAFVQKEGKEVEKIILAGGMAFLPGLKEHFSKELNKEILIGNPFLNILHNSALKDILREIGPSYAIAAGLAMKGLE